ncbi:hypothetical protein BJX63DRAFT_303885 [Aspergillus granulosus]|uniref:Leucine-rich repeat domain-containing protein n=1 Tax=Aspergillus granulosus TaxID=176169 RepID=A0ABR4H7H1_9EURO
MLSTIPREIVLLVTNHLDNHKDILNLASCTQDFHALLLPRAFTSIVLADESFYQLTRLTHTLAQSPKCAQAVRVLRFDPNLPTAPGIPEGGRVKYNQEVIVPLLKTLTSSRKDVAEWEKDLKQEENMDAWIAILLSLVPNLEELAMTFFWPSLYVRRLLAKNTKPGTNSTFLPRLKKIRARWWDTENGLRSSYIFPFFRLPSLRTFNGVMIDDGTPYDKEDLRGEENPEDDNLYDESFEEYPDYETDPEGDFRFYPGSEDFSGVTHIQLEYSNTGKGFPDLIRACQKLVVFIYEHGHCGNLDQLAPRRFYPSLCKHKSSLEELAICYDRWWDAVGEEAERQFIGSFVEFRVLKRLRLRGDNLIIRDGGGEEFEAAKMPGEMLPPSLETLTIEDFSACADPKGLMKQLKDLRNAVELQCPNLVSLKVITAGGDTQPQENGWPLYSEPSRCVYGMRRAIELVDCVVEDTGSSQEYREILESKNRPIIPSLYLPLRFQEALQSI